MNEIVSSVIAFAIGGIAYVVLIVILKNKRKRRTTAEIIESIWAKMNKQDKGGTEMSKKEQTILEEAAKEYASKILCDPDDGPSTGLVKQSFIAGANYQRLKRLAEAAKSSSHLDAYIEGVRRSIEKQISLLPPPPPGYYYTWELDTIRKEGQSFTAIARPLLKQIDPER